MKHDRFTQLHGADTGRILREMVRAEAARIIEEADAPIANPDAALDRLHKEIEELRSEIRERSGSHVQPHVEQAAGLLETAVEDPAPPSLSRPATATLRKLRQAELDVHDLGEDPRIALSDTLSRHGVKIGKDGQVAPLLRISDAVEAACRLATPEIRKKNETTGRYVIEFLGDLPLEDLGDKIEDLMREMSRLPKTHGKKHGKNRFTDKSIQKSKHEEIREADEKDRREIEKLAERTDLSEADKRAHLIGRLEPRVTVNNLRRHLDSIHRILRAAEKELGYDGKTKLLDYKTLDLLVAQETEKQRETNPIYFRATVPKTRDRWDDAYLKTLFTSPLYRGSHRGRRSQPGKVLIRDALYWIPLIMLTMGTRVTEVLQLRRRDLIIKSRIHCLRLCWEVDQHGKTQEATRIVPVSQVLIDLGFLDWIMRLGEPTAYLFKEIVDAKPSDPGSIFGKRMATLMKGLKIVRRQVFSEIAGGFVTEALVRFLFKFRRQRPDAATGVVGWSVS